MITLFFFLQKKRSYHFQDNKNALERISKLKIFN